LEDADAAEEGTVALDALDAVEAPEAEDTAPEEAVDPELTETLDVAAVPEDAAKTDDDDTEACAPLLLLLAVSPVGQPIRTTITISHIDVIHFVTCRLPVLYLWASSCLSADPGGAR